MSRSRHLQMKMFPAAKAAFMVFFGLIALPSILWADEALFSMEVFSNSAVTVDDTPFWIWALRDGAIDPDSSTGIAGFRAEISQSPTRWLDLRATGEIEARVAEEGTLARIPEATVVARVHPLQFQVGRWKEILGEVYEPLSSGSLIRSGNSLNPFMIRLGIPAYWSLPYIGEYAQIRGGVSHAWMGKDRYVQNAFLHEKYGYIRITPISQLQLHAGLVHEAVWGGTSVTGTSYPSGIDDFFRVFMIDGGGSDAPVGEQINRLGSHLGIWDFGLAWSTEQFWVQSYYQHYFEARSSSRFNNRADGLWGVALGTTVNNLELSGLYELLLTKYQGGDVSHNEGGRQMYYENYIYRTGWSYRDYVMGTPLIGVKEEGDDLYFYNTRIIAHHGGIQLSQPGRWTLRHLSTISSNYGRYYTNPDERFDSGSLLQYSGLLELKLQDLRYQGLSGTVGVGWDIGELYENSFGAILGVEYAWN